MFHICQFFGYLKDAESKQRERKVLERIGIVSYGSLIGIINNFYGGVRFTLWATTENAGNTPDGKHYKLKTTLQLFCWLEHSGEQENLLQRFFFN
jgi:hypothetical protein